MPGAFYHWYQTQYARLHRLSWGSFKRWYLNPHMRSSRTSFNTLIFAATIPGMLFGIGSMMGFLSPVMDVMSLGQHISAGADPGSITSLTDALQTMQNGAPAADATGKAVIHIDWSTLVNILIMGALTPLFMGRARDIGIRNVWIPTLLAQSSLVTDFIGLFGIGTGPFGWLTGIVSFGMAMWLCTKKSKPLPPPPITPPPAPAAAEGTTTFNNGPINPYV